MRKLIAPTLSLSMMFVSSCGEAMDQYKQANVEIVSVIRDEGGSIQITYRPMIESIYYSPGAIVEIKDGRHKVSIVRCGIKEQCSVDLPAKKVGEGRLVLIVHDSRRPIDAVFSDGEKKLLP